MAPLSKWCKKAIPRWIKRDKNESKKVNDNDWSFKDRTLPWDDEPTVSDDSELWDGWNENAMLDIVLVRDGEEQEGEDGFLRGTSLEWNEADVIDSAQFDDVRYGSDKANFLPQDEMSHHNDDDESQFNNDDDDVSRFDNDDESQFDNDNDDMSRFDNDDSYYHEDICDDLEIDDDSDTSHEWTDDMDSMDGAVDAFLDAFLGGCHRE